MAHLSSIETLEARGMQRSNQDFDVLSAALDFLDAVAPDVAESLRQPTQLAIGQRVHVKRECARFSKVVETRQNELGTRIYVLADGGWFGANELELAR
jgi:hypothetical protein